MGAGSPTKLCEICEEAGVVRLARVVNPKRMCSTHYNQQQPDRHKKLSFECGWCGRACSKDRTRRYAERFCSLDCRGEWRAWLSGKQSCPVEWRSCEHCDSRWSNPAIQACPSLRCARLRALARQQQRAPRLFVCGTCDRCGDAYVAEDYTDTARYCSLRCSRRVSKQRYRARKKDAYVADVSPARIYERDGWRCKLCRKKVDRTKVVPHPKAPVLDHVVPLADGGTHEPANVQCAHYLCNSIKGARGGYEQLALIG